MYQAKITNVSGSRVLAGGKWLNCIGNLTVEPGDYIWTDGRCVYGSQQEGGGAVPLATAMSSEIPLLAGIRHFVYSRGELQPIASRNYEYMLNTGHKIKYFGFDECIMDAEVDAEGNIYTLIRVVAAELHDWGQYPYHSIRNSKVVTLRKNGETILEFDTGPYFAALQSESLGYRERIDGVSNSSVTTYSYCTNGYVDKNGNYGFFMSMYSWGGYYNDSNLFLALYYVDNGTVTLLMHSRGHVIGYNPLGGLQTYYTGALGMKFPIHNGYYYTMKNRPGVEWAVYLNPVADMTIYDPNGEIVLVGEFVVGTRFTVTKLGKGRYLLGLDARKIVTQTLWIYLGHLDLKYEGIMQYYDDYVKNGVYLVENGVMKCLYDRRCRALRFRKMDSVNLKLWKRKIKALDTKEEFDYG